MNKPLPVCPDCRKPMTEEVSRAVTLFAIPIPFSRAKFELWRWKDFPDCQCDEIPF